MLAKTMVLKFFVHIVKNLEPGILNTNSPSCNWSDHPRIYASPDHSHWCFTYRIKTKLFHSSVLRSLISFILVCHLTPSPPHVISYVILCHAQLLVITCLRELYQTLILLYLFPPRKWFLTYLQLMFLFLHWLFYPQLVILFSLFLQLSIDTIK